jgi:chromatin remodeling complex protein RSC6
MCFNRKYKWIAALQWILTWYACKRLLSRTRKCINHDNILLQWSMTRVMSALDEETITKHLRERWSERMCARLKYVSCINIWLRTSSAEKRTHCKMLQRKKHLLQAIANTHTTHEIRRERDSEDTMNLQQQKSKNRFPMDFQVLRIKIVQSRLAVCKGQHC